MLPRGDAIRILLRIAFRNLFASKVRTAIIGAIVLGGSFLVVLGSSLLDSIDKGMKTSIQGSLGGHLQVYNEASEDALELYGGLRGESRLKPIEDFAKVKAALSEVPGVRKIVPMGIDQAMVATGNVIDQALEKLRADVRRVEAGDRSPASLRGYEARKAHVRRIVSLTLKDRDQARVIADLEGKYAEERRREYEDLARAAGDAFWREFDADPLPHLEFLENRVAKAAADGGFTFLRYVGTDPQAFFDAFELAQVAEGQMIPKGKRGVLVGKQFAEEWLKVKNARRLDLIKEARDRRGRKIAKDEELQRWVKDNLNGTKEILLQLDPIQAETLQGRLRAALAAADPAAAGEDLPKLLARLFDTTDQNFDERFRIFYAEVAPLLRLYLINVGDVITIKAPSKSGYFNSVNVKVYGFIQFRQIEKSGIAGMMSVLDLMSFRDLYGYLTAEKRAEIAALQASVNVKDVSREDAEAALFGGGGSLEGEAKAKAIDEGTVLRPGGSNRPAEDLLARVYPQEEIDHGVVLNAALVLDDPTHLRRSAAALQRASDAAGLGLKVTDWKSAAGIVGQFVTLLTAVLYVSIFLFFAVALVIINNAMVMATLQRVKEIGTMRAIGAQRRFVLVMLLVETATVGLVFGIVGAILGGVAVWAVRAGGGIPATTDLLNFVFSGPALLPSLGAASLVVSLVIVVLVSILSGFYPALLAMRVTPVEAMATED